MITYVTRGCWFLGSTDDAWAFTFHGDDLVGKHLIILSDDLLAQSSKQIQHSVAHEIGHVILGHKNAILETQTRKQIARQEKEADEFAQRFGM